MVNNFYDDHMLNTFNMSDYNFLPSYELWISNDVQEKVLLESKVMHRNK